MTEKSSDNLPRLVFVDKEKCINCHACISVCPVKFCNDGSGDHVNVNPETCIGCGRCLHECTHGARHYVDDFAPFMENIGNGEKVVAIAAPSLAANFPGRHLEFNAWLKSIGVKAVFDVSFGAELTVKSYMEHMKNNNPEMVIAQPCPAIVTYLELYQPELLDHLAPVDSPMLHTIKMIRRFYPEYNDCKVAVISPCVAKKREFAETGHGDYNIGYVTIDNYFNDNGISLESYPKVDYDNPPPERAVLFSTPGGLLRTAERWAPGIGNMTRKTEGIDSIYEYFKKLPEVIGREEKMAPVLLDCLNCEMGCNGGTLTLCSDKSPDEIEYWIEQRNEEMRELYAGQVQSGEGKSIEEVVEEFWEEGLYTRQYYDRSDNAHIKIPNDAERDEIYHAMHKFSEDDIYNCSACGYGTCERMATAIFNGLNRPDNCHHFLESEREISRKKITENEKRLRTILETSLEGFLEVNGDNKIVSVNSAMATIMATKEENLVGMSIFDLAQDEKNKQIFYDQIALRETGKSSSYEIYLTKSDGTLVPTIFHATPLLNGNNKRVGSFAMVSDITELKKAEGELLEHQDNLEKKVTKRTKELREANDRLVEVNEKLVEMDKVKSDFVSSVSHELRTPLTSVLGFAKIIQKRLNDVLFPQIVSDDKKVNRAKGQVDDNIGIIIAEGQRLTNMINDVLDLAKMEAGKLDWNMQPVDPAELIRRSTASTSSLFEQKNIKLETDIENNLPEINGDPDRLIQVVVNLLSNAVKFTDEGAVVCKAHAENGHVVISVKDSGIGISKEDAPKIFTKFKQVGDTLTDKPKGTGLGLVICKEITEYHGGKIWFESEYGHGSTFLISLPVLIKTTPTIKNVDRAKILDELNKRRGTLEKKENNSEKTILIVDDDQNIRTLLKQELEGSKFRIIEATDGYDAVEQVRNNEPDLIILDIMMPGMNGFDVAAVLKNDPLLMRIPIIILSVVEDRERAEKLGVEIYMTKPVKSSALTETIDSLLENPTAKKKILVFDPDVTLVNALSEVMRAQGYTVVEVFEAPHCLDIAREIKPDIVIADALAAEQIEIVQTLKFEKDMENVLFFLLGEKDSE